MLMSTTGLMKIIYSDAKAEVCIECYADTVVIENENKKSYIIAIRLGGYPEAVKGMSDAIFGGGSVSIEIEGKPQTLSSKLKQYTREYNHDGLYAEAVLRIKDEEQRKASLSDKNANSDNGTDHSNGAPRKCYMFCGHKDAEQLYHEVDKKTSVPLIPQFQDFVLRALKARKILVPLQVISTNERFDAWVLHMSSEEKNIIDVVNDGIFSGEIAIPSATSNDFPVIGGVTDYLNAFGVQIAERIKGQFNPLFDPATEALSSEIMTVNNYIIENAGYSLYDAQLAVSETLKRCLTRKKVALCIAECGSGKTKIGATALHAYQQRPFFRKYSEGVEISDPPAHRKKFNIVLCPSHMAKKWVREIEETLPDTYATIATSIQDLMWIYSTYEHDYRTCYVILTKEKARDGYMVRPAVMWNHRRRRFICPHCYSDVEMDLTDSGSKYKVPADQFYFRKETRQNRKCENKDCGELLWTALAPEVQSEWVKISNYGFIHRKFAYSYLELVEKKPKILEAILTVAENPEGEYAANGAYRRYALSTYIKNKMRGKIDGLIIDELHDYNNNSGQGDAMGELFQVAKKVIGMTATLINGYSSGVFHLLYRIAPHLMLCDNKSYDKPLDFNDEYGVTESVYEIDAPDYNANRRTVKRKLRERQLPGVSPLVYTRFLMENAAFLSLNDMGKDLPEYEEIPIMLPMKKDVFDEYKRIEKLFIEIFKNDRKIAKKVLSTYLNLLIVYPDQPYGHDPVKHPITGNNLIIPNDTSSENEQHEKDTRVIDIVERKVQAGERVLIYTSWVRIDTQTKMTKLLQEKGYRVATLTAATAPQKREAWVEKQVHNGIQVLICNPSLVQTGLDLNDFTTIIYYNVSYKLFTLRQSSRRSWRINQRAPRVEVYFIFYANSMQQRAIRLMASKLAVAGVIEGNLTDEGLAAMSDCQDMTTALARELTQGIEGEVEDLGEVFKRMALLKPAVIDISDEDVVVKDVSNDAIAKPKSSIVKANAQSAIKDEKRKQPIQSHGLLKLLQPKKPKKAPTKKAIAVCVNQMSLDDLYDYSA